MVEDNIVILARAALAWRTTDEIARLADRGLAVYAGARAAAIGLEALGIGLRAIGQAVAA